jgi:hypothetical protein
MAKRKMRNIITPNKSASRRVAEEAEHWDTDQHGSTQKKPLLEIIMVLSFGHPNKQACFSDREKAPLVTSLQLAPRASPGFQAESKENRIRKNMTNSQSPAEQG